jgi:single-strand DNA-binding protein
MAGSVNKVILIGNLGKDPEVRVLENGAKLARFPLATSENYQDKQTGERREITEWHNIVVWRGLADVAENYLRKGSKVFVEGKIRTRSWQDETGAAKYATEIIADNFTMLSARQEGQLAATSPYPTQEPARPSSAIGNDLTSNRDDDDLPF